MLLRPADAAPPVGAEVALPRLALVDEHELVAGPPRPRATANSPASEVSRKSRTSARNASSSVLNRRSIPPEATAGSDGGVRSEDRVATVDDDGVTVEGDGGIGQVDGHRTELVGVGPSPDGRAADRGVDELLVALPGAIRSVSVQPGRRALTRMRWRARFTATARTRPRSAVFERRSGVELGAVDRRGRRHGHQRPALAPLDQVAGAEAEDTKAPSRLTAITRRHSSRVRSTNDGTPPVTPALAKTLSTLPRTSTVRSKLASWAASSATSHTSVCT